ncbi:MAG: O-antigen ligase family protein, partial [Desulfohalobiaceae bacterium]|nr:O-antigen ligase family protein [Desulfohalobiaceae bacterium]
FQVFVPQADVLWSGIDAYEGCARGTFVNRNHFACFLNLLWPVLLAWIMSLEDMQPRTKGMSRAEHQEQIRYKKFLYGFLVGLAILALFFSRSRGGIFSALVGLTVFLFLNRSRRAETVVLVCAAWAVMLAYGWIIGFEEILARFDQIERSTGRLFIWEDTWRMVMDHPWLGVGMNAFETIGRVYNTSLPESKFYYHAHNDYLQLMAEVGLPLAVTLILAAWTLWLVMARRVRQKARQAQGLEALLAAGALAGCAAFLVHSAVEFNWQIPANQVYFLVMMGLAWLWAK